MVARVTLAEIDAVRTSIPQAVRVFEESVLPELHEAELSRIETQCHRCRRIKLLAWIGEDDQPAAFSCLTSQRQGQHHRAAAAVGGEPLGQRSWLPASGWQKVVEGVAAGGANGCLLRNAALFQLPDLLLQGLQQGISVGDRSGDC